MKLKAIDTACGLESLDTRWNELLDKLPHRDISYSFQWHNNWVRSFTAGKKLRVIVIEKDDQLLSILPLYEEKIHFSNIQLNVLKSLTNAESNRFDMLADDKSGELFAKSVSAAFASGKQQVMVLDHVPANSYIMKSISDVCDNMKWNYTVSDHSTNYLVKPANSFSDYYNSLDGKFRKNVNAAYRKAQSRGGLTLKYLTNSDELDGFLARGFALEASGWKGKKGTAIESNSVTKRFYEGIAKDFQRRGEFKAFLLENNGDDLAFYYCIAGYGVVRALKIGVNEKLKHLAPGMLATREVLADLHNTPGINEWNFCGGESRWKRDWGNATEKLWRVDIYNNSIFGRTFYKLRTMYHDLRGYNEANNKLINFNDCN